MAKRIAVVLSQGQSQHPAKRQLEEDIAAALLMEPGIDLVIVPHLYDLKPDGTGTLALSNIKGNMIVLAWLFDRATRWTLDRMGIRGKEGTSLLKSADEETDEDEDEAAEAEETAAASEKTRVNDSRDLPNRKIYCLDLRVQPKAETFVEEVKRIAREASMQLIGLGGLGGGIGSKPTGPSASGPSPAALARFAEPTNSTALPIISAPDLSPVNTPFSFLTESKSADASGETPSQIIRIEETGDRRWYPVIDYSRCTNCMECIDFCLFGVYGLDRADTILVEQPDNCRKGCPACSRVCPENAIIFPQHKTPSIAGSPEVAGSMKIDLSRLFGAPETGESAEQAAVRERDEQLQLAGRTAVGASVGLPKRQASAPQPKDELDSLLDSLDELDI
ncbi:Ferredoxin-2 [Anatilimnocola aggregata]|uniref:Ferredoxin-2 n=1 Tax=Anatilimnocola aggregata TaxID=2528021 RepID=A0A517Y5Y1_9BACT|nr:ferredoxin family protein [Anatilimnocola aggregata]QDU25616.1 Ferredoxin-2 [Anatilimnocola aggregata]